MSDLPVVIAIGKEVLRNPSTIAVADMLGLTENVDADEVFDVAVIGAGPSGLATAVYAASEGLRTIVLEGLAPAGRPARARRSRITWDFQPESPARRSQVVRRCRRRNLARVLPSRAR